MKIHIKAADKTRYALIDNGRTRVRDPKKVNGRDCKRARKATRRMDGGRQKPQS